MNTIFVIGESNVYTLGNIGAHRIVCTKLPTVGHTREAMTAAGNTTTRLLGMHIFSRNFYAPFYFYRTYIYTILYVQVHSKRWILSFSLELVAVCLTIQIIINMYDWVM